MENSLPINKIICGDCLEEMKKLPDNSVDSIVTDPPAGIGFLGERWDNKGSLLSFQDFIYQVFSEAIRVLKPGGHALVWALPRTAHHTAMGIERAGFEIRDKIYFIFGSGFPKSLDVSKKLKKTGNEKEAEQWRGLGTSLKPAVEEWILAKKPISEKNIAKNVLKFGTGGLNIDECKIGNDAVIAHHAPKGTFAGGEQGRGSDTNYYTNMGRFPSHLILDGSEEVEKCFPHQKSGNRSSKYKVGNENGEMFNHGIYGKYKAKKFDDVPASEGSASRFFQHCPTTEEDLEYNRIFYGSKASKKERGEGNDHPTVKNLSLMRYLCRLITPKKGIVLDPFLGSGTTAMACILEGFNFIGIEKEKEYCEIAQKRIDACPKPLL